MSMKWVQNRMERGGLANTTTHATTHVPDASLRSFEVMVGEKKNSQTHLHFVAKIFLDFFNGMFFV